MVFMDFTYSEISKLIDHALLGPTLTLRELSEGTSLARAYDVASVCVIPHFLKSAAELLSGSSVLPSTTVGFPHGGHTTRAKLVEAEQALDDGARELDMVINIGRAKSGDWPYVSREIGEILELTRARGQKLKVIFENCFLSDSEKLELCRISGELGVDWAKTSTGYGSAGATDADLKLMRAHLPAHVALKASGGVRSFARLLDVRALGVTRVGASATAQILDECRQRLGLAPL
jgi:deoxyribose-phosphate aldolase